MSDFFSSDLRESTKTKSGAVMVTNSERIFPPSSSSSRYLQGATVSLLHDHLHVVEDEVESHAPNGLHRLLHEPDGKDRVETREVNEKQEREVETTAHFLPFHIFYNQIQLLQIFIVDQIGAIFHHLQDVLLHGL